MAAFYNKADQTIYEGGQHFIPQEEYRLGYTPPAIMAQNTAISPGIVNTQAATPYIWPPRGGGDGGGVPDDDDTGYSDFGLSPGALGGKLSGFKGWADRAFGGFKFSDIPTPINLIKKGVDKYQNWKDEKDEEDAAIAEAQRKNTVTNIKKTGIYNLNGYIPTGLRGDPDPIQPPIPPTPSVIHHTGGGNGGGIGSPESQMGGAPGTAKGEGSWKGAQGGRIGYNRGRVVNPGGYSGEKDWLSLKGYDDMMEGMSDDEIIKLFDSVRGTWSKAQGGRIGYKWGSSDPEEPAENIFEFMRDQDIPSGEMVSDEWNDRLLEQLYNRFIEEGFSPEDAAIMAQKEFGLMSQGSEQDQGIASLV